MRGAQGNTLLNRELDELRVTLEAELLHHSIFMECDGARCHAENTGRFFHGTPFHEQLKHLTLARGQFAGCGTLAFSDKGIIQLGRSPAVHVDIAPDCRRMASGNSDAAELLRRYPDAPMSRASW